MPRLTKKNYGKGSTKGNKKKGSTKGNKKKGSFKTKQKQRKSISKEPMKKGSTKKKRIVLNITDQLKKVVLKLNRNKVKESVQRQINN